MQWSNWSIDQSQGWGGSDRRRTDPDLDLILARSDRIPTLRHRIDVMHEIRVTWDKNPNKYFNHCYLYQIMFAVDNLRSTYAMYASFTYELRTEL